MIVLVPVSRFRVPYDTARGRPYSPLEAMILEAVANGGASFVDLRSTFRVHERLLVESVVTLVTAGWIAVAGGPQARFVLTSAGALAAHRGAEPVSVVVTSAKPQTVIMERVTGQVARQADARPWNRRELGEEAWQQAAVMRERIIRNSLDEAQVQKLLQRETGHWVRRIGPIRLTSRGTHYVAVDAAPDTGQIRGLPHAWADALSGKVLDYARANRSIASRGLDAQFGKSRAKDRHRPRFDGVTDARHHAARATSFELREHDVLETGTAHDAALRSAFDNARTSVALVAPTVGDMARYRQFVDLAAVAVARGVAVDLLVGEVKGVSASDLVAIAHTAAYKADPHDGRRRLRFRNTTTGSGASLLVHDTAPGALTAVIGNYDWGAQHSPLPLSVRVSEPSLVADIARAVASLWTGRGWVSADWAGPAERWRRLASQAEEEGALSQAGRPTSDVGRVTFGELLVDDEHAGLNPTRTAVLVGGHRPDPDAGDGAMRGVTLCVTGEGASMLRTDR